jgi:hypothetical protein
MSEGLLMANGEDGSYLLRPSKKEGQLSLSIRYGNFLFLFKPGRMSIDNSHDRLILKLSRDANKSPQLERTY